MGAVAMQRGMDGVTEAMTPERGSMSVMMERGRSAAMGRNARENHWTSGSVDRQSVCGAGVMGAGSVRTGMGLKMFTAGMNSLMVAAGDKAAAVLVGRETSAAKGKLQLVSLRLKKKKGPRKTESAGTSRAVACCLDLLKKRSHSSVSPLLFPLIPAP